MIEIYHREKIRGLKKGGSGGGRRLSRYTFRTVSRGKRRRGKGKKAGPAAETGTDGRVELYRIGCKFGWKQKRLETTLDTRPYQQVLVYDAAAETVGIDIDSDAI